jgi:hypothetical protein
MWLKVLRTAAADTRRTNPRGSDTSAVFLGYRRASEQVCLQASRLQLNVSSAESALERLSLNGCLQAAHSADVCAPARRGLRVVNHRLVLLIQNQPLQRRFRSLLSASQTGSFRSWLGGLLQWTAAYTEGL